MARADHSDQSCRTRGAWPGASVSLRGCIISFFKYVLERNHSIFKHHLTSLPALSARQLHQEKEQKEKKSLFIGGVTSTSAAAGKYTLL